MSKKAPKEKKLKIFSEATDFFKQEVTKALGNQRIETDPNTEFYLVDLLTRFIATDNLFAISEKGARREETLALLMGEALSSTDTGRRHRGLRRLGDVSLYTAGFFQARLARKVVDVDYYIGMGRNAYSSLAAMGADTFFTHVFVELSQNFHRFVDVLVEISELSGTQDAKNILRQYEVWLKTRSSRAEKNLKDAGIVPNKLVKPDWQ